MGDIIWPQPVIRASENILKVIRDSLDLTEVQPEVLRENLRTVFLEKFNSNQELVITEDEFVKTYTTSVIQTTLNSLQAKGLVNSIEDEKGENVYWLTDAARDYLEENPSEVPL